MGVFQIGNPTKCAICHRFNQWVQDCPNRDNGNTNIVNGVVLHQRYFDNTNELKCLIPETWSSALLHRRASKTVRGEEWLIKYITNLNNNEM